MHSVLFEHVDLGIGLLHQCNNLCTLVRHLKQLLSPEVTVN
jgi:hypothetical protein